MERTALVKVVDKLGMLARFIVGLVFVFAAVGKIVDPEFFARSIERYQLLPVAVVNIVAVVLPWIELFVGMALVFGIRIRAAALIGGVLLFVFTLAVASAWARGLNIECGCFSQTGASAVVSLQKIAENIGLLLATAVAYVAQSMRFDHRSVVQQ